MEARDSSASSDAWEIAASLADPERFTTIVRRHFSEIFGYLGRRIGRDAAQDLAAETFVVAFQNRRRYDNNRPDARPWLYGIATNLLRHHRRTEMRQIAAYARAAWNGEVSADNTEPVADHLDARDSLRRVAWAFAHLDQEQRDALYLVGVAGLSYAEAADALGLKPGTLHSRVARGRVHLRDLVASRGQQRERPSISTPAEKR